MLSATIVELRMAVPSAAIYRALRPQLLAVATVGLNHKCRFEN